MASFGQIKEFNSAIESWTFYTERLEQFFVANGIEDENRRRAIFLTVVGPSTYGLLRDLLSPEAPTAKTLEQLIQRLNQHFDPVPSEIVERYKFNSRVRHAGESVTNYIAELRRLAKFCNYGATLDVMLRDRIVCGIQDEAIQRKLLSETQLTLARATEISVSMETAARDSANLRITAITDVNKMQAERAVPSTNKKCYRCGDLKHQSKDCKFKDATCHFCKKVGHLARICQAKRKSQSTSNVNNVQASPKKCDTSSKQYTLLNIRSVGEALPPAKVLCKVQGELLWFEVDSGAPFTLIPSGVFEKFKKVFPPLEDTNIKLQSYTKHAIDVLGVTNVDVTFQSRTENLPLLVVKQGSVSLAGRNWIFPLGLMAVFESRNSAYCVKQPEAFNDVRAISTDLTLKKLLDKFKDLFSPGLGRVKDVKVHLSCRPEVVPKFFKARSVPYALKEKVDSEIDRLIEDGVLEPVKTSEWAAPIVPVLKPDGHVRICGDFKLTVNKATELEQYPLPKIEDLFANLSGGHSFTKLDLKDAYCQLELDDESKNLVVINTHRGLFRYTRLPFGVASAPAIFQREMDKILQGQNGASCYLDDQLVTGQDDTKHLQHLNQVLTRLQAAGIKLNPEKCKFLKDSVEYLGHRIDKHGLHPIESKVDAVVKAPHPKNVDELRSFIGLVTYYAKFLPNMATMLAPLYKLLENKQSWKWGMQEKEAFSKIKETLQGSSLLVHFDNEKEVILACDASPYGLGAVLSHETSEGERPIAFASRSLTKAEKNYSHIEKETLALVFGVTRFRNYLLGRTFTLLTDHRPLVSLLSEDKPVPSVAAARIQRWALTLSAYAYKIRYRKGNLHGNADACSRLPLQTVDADPPMPAEAVLQIAQLDDSPVTRHLIESEIAKCSLLTRLKSYILKGWPKKVPKSLNSFWLVRNDLSIDENIIFRGIRVFIPPKFRDYIMDELHGTHQGISAIKSLARSYVWWPGIDRDLESKVQSCVTCQENASAPPARQVSWPVPTQSWERIHIDHAGPVEGHMLLVVTDAKTKWLEVIPVPNVSSISAIKVLRDLFARFGLPKTLVSDNGTAFSSAEFYSFLGKNGITHVRTAPYHPNSNGLAERSVRTVKSALKKVTQGTFAERLARFLLNYRNTPSASTGISPAVNMLGRTLRTRLDLLTDDAHSPEMIERSSHTAAFKIGEPVWARQFGRGPRWVAGRVSQQVGNVMFKVKTTWGTWTRHVDQLRRRVVSAITKGSPASGVTESDSPGSSDQFSRPGVSDLPVQVPQYGVEPSGDFHSNLPVHPPHHDEQGSVIDCHLDSSVVSQDIEEPNGVRANDNLQSVPSPTILRRSNRRVHPPIRLNL